MSNDKTFKGTPGPWTAINTHTTPRIGHLPEIKAPDGSLLFTSGGGNVETVMANVHCAKAAPNLLEALQEVVEYHEGRGKYNFSKLNDNDRAHAAYDAWQDIWTKKIHTAIAKALGE